MDAAKREQHMTIQDAAVPVPTGAEADRLIQAAVRAAVLEHKRAGHPVAAWQDGTVVWIPADEIDLPEDDAV